MMERDYHCEYDPPLASAQFINLTQVSALSSLELMIHFDTVVHSKKSVMLKD